MTEVTAGSTHGVDELLPAPRLIALGIQHVLVMYAGAIAVPLIIAGALGLPADQRALLISADVLACGLATLVQTIGFPGVGIRLPVMMGVTFASVAPMVAMINSAKEQAGPAFVPTDALSIVYGSVIVAGIFAILIAPLMSRLLPLFPPIVTGSIILIIGVSLMRIGVGWAEGPFTVVQVVDGVAKVVTNPNRDALDGLALALLVLLVILFITRFAKGFLSNVAVLAGIVVGAVVAAATGKMSFDAVSKASAFDFVRPFQFGWPEFQVVPAITLCVVMIVVMIESTGMFLALGEMTGKKIAQPN
jgi:uracil-xanthine permease